MLAFRLALLAGAVVCAAPAWAAPIAERAMQQAQANGRAKIIVALQRTDNDGVTDRRKAIATRCHAVMQATRADDVSLDTEYESVAGFAATASPAGLEQLARHPDVRAIDFDEPGGMALDKSVPHIRADILHDRGLTGTGVVIAILDTGVDSTHPDIQEALIHEECFCTTCCPNNASRQSGPGAADTRHDHGMNVAGIAVSRGNVAPVGVAPGAQLVAVKILDNRGIGTPSDWIAALDWIATDRPEVRVVNMSVQMRFLYETACDEDGATNMLFSDLVNRLYRRGTLLVAAAGNQPLTSPPSLDAISSPACIRRAIGVGAVDDSDVVASFSNSAAILDLLAPGVDIFSDGARNRTTIMSGTSMATPHVTGVAALLFSAHPNAAAGLIESALKVGVRVTDHRNGLTFPRLDALAAYNAVSRQTDSLLGGGAADTDCWLQWSFDPPNIGRDGPRPLAACIDNDPTCDHDTIDGQCTFALNFCLRARNPRLPRCQADQPLTGYDLTWPRADGPGNAPANMTRIVAALPPFPLNETDFCTSSFEYVVARSSPSMGGTDAIRLAVQTATGRDYDRVSLICNPPQH